MKYGRSLEDPSRGSRGPLPAPQLGCRPHRSLLSSSLEGRGPGVTQCGQWQTCWVDDGDLRSGVSANLGPHCRGLQLGPSPGPVPRAVLEPSRAFLLSLQ